MNKIFSLAFLISFNVIATEITEYKAKYQFDSEDISITGVREFSKIEKGYELKFKASNLIASMYFSSLFDINENEIKSTEYKIKIRPKFLNRDQQIDFNYQSSIIQSIGRNEWKSTFNINESTLDPLNAQIMIRKNIKNGLSKFSLNLINMREGGIEKYDYLVADIITCSFGESSYKCVVLERTKRDSTRKTTYYLAEDLDFMFIRITDVSDEWKNTLELKEILSFG
tara:strand:- start:7 stop:687 length:681 start_codon:yes stop_codon:yes gene_type:complete